jgi:hypothetical protein
MRERMERRSELRREWAEKRAAKAAAAFKAAHTLGEMIPFGQPILVGHHSEKRARAHAKKIETSMVAGVESERMVVRHERKAATIDSRLKRTIFSDDTDAAENLKKRIADRERVVVRMKFVNKAHATFLKTGSLPEGVSESESEKIRNYKPSYTWEPHPFPPYAVTNLRNQIAADRKRLAMVQQMATRSAAAKEASEGVLIEGGEFVRVTFAEKPPREILDELKAAGFRWSGGGWNGYRAKLPASVAGGALLLA